jgi:hypothetical protein
MFRITVKSNEVMKPSPLASPYCPWEHIGVVVAVGDAVGDTVGLTVGDIVGVGDSVAVADGVGELVTVADGVGEAVTVDVGDRVGVGVSQAAVQVAVGVGVIHGAIKFQPPTSHCPSMLRPTATAVPSDLSPTV